MAQEKIKSEKLRSFWEEFTALSKYLDLSQNCIEEVRRRVSQKIVENEQSLKK